MNNLLVNLRKWVSRQDDNFTTESLAHLLRHLCENESEVAARLLTKMTNCSIAFTPDTTKVATIKTQVTTEEGRPDIEISFPGSLVYVEAKVESGLGPDQLERYRRELDRAREQGKATQTALVLLTRYPPPDTGVKPDAAIRWHDIAEWLSLERCQNTINDPVSAYLVDSFLGYLKERGMIMEPVRRDLIGGAQSLWNLILMLKEAATACGQSVKESGEFERIGFTLGDRRFFVGVQYDSANVIIFHTMKVRIDPKAATKIGFGDVRKRYYSPDKRAWWHTLDLAAKDGDFFTHPLVGQKECLEQFLKCCLDAVKRLETVGEPGAPPDPSEVQTEHDNEEEQSEESQP